MDRNQKNWQAPPFETNDADKLGWVKQAIDDGTSWVQRQIDTGIIQQGIDILAGKSGSDLSNGWSKLSTSDLKRGVREIVETLANIRLSFAGFQTQNRAFLEHADMLNKVAEIIYLKCFVDRSLRDALQFGALTGAGFISPGYKRGMHGSGKGNFTFEALSQLDVLPVQLPRDRNYQEAYVVTLAKIRGVAEAHALFPAYQDKLRPFAKNKYLKGGSVGRQEYQTSRWRMHSMSEMVEQYTDIFYSYVLDLRINDRPWGKNDALAPMPMGQPGTSWYYEVPFVGQPIQVFEGGKMITREAGDEDCRVYPKRRLMISCDAALMYDGPGFDWHAKVPATPFYLDDWAWDGTGNSLFTNTAQSQYAIDDLIRSMYRIAMARVNMSKSYNTDITTPDKSGKLSPRQAESVDPFSTNVTYGVDGDIKEPVFRPLMPQWCYDIPEQEFKAVELLQNDIAKALGLDQIQSLQKLRANIQSPEKLLEAEGPVVIGTSRSMERGLRELGTMTGSNILQYCPTGVIVQMVGVEQVPQVVFDYDPDSLIPSHLPGEDTTESTVVNGEVISIPKPSSQPRDMRAKVFNDNIEYTVEPHSLHEIAQNQRRLNLLALIGKNIPIDPETVAKAFDIPNWGSLDGSTIKDKLLSWAKEQLMDKATLAKLQGALGLNPPEEEGGGHGATGKPKGRPSTDKKNPVAKQKGAASGGRVVLSTSG